MARVMQVQGAPGTREAGRNVLEASASARVLPQASADVRMSSGYCRCLFVGQQVESLRPFLLPFVGLWWVYSVCV